MLRRLRAFSPARLLALAGLAFALSSAVAAPPPMARPGATLRLVDAGMADGRPRIGLEIALEPGWKTYWRTPGDAGIPPSLDWSKSTGIAALETRFPAPVRFGEEGAWSIGYVEPVILPLDVTLVDPTRPATLDLDVLVGVCHDICLPISAHLTATLGGSAPVDPGAAARLAEARARLPVPAVEGVAPWVISLERDHDSVPAALSATVAMPAEEEGEEDRCDVLVEGPNGDWALPLPVKVAESAGREVWRFDLDGLPDGASIDGAALRFTIRAADRVVEQTVRLDAAGIAP